MILQQHCNKVSHLHQFFHSHWAKQGWHNTAQVCNFIQHAGIVKPKEVWKTVTVHVIMLRLVGFLFRLVPPTVYNLKDAVILNVIESLTLKNMFYAWNDITKSSLVSSRPCWLSPPESDAVFRGKVHWRLDREDWTGGGEFSLNFAIFFLYKMSKTVTTKTQ